MNKTIIGIHGFAQTGKDALARVLVEQHGYERIAFADPMRAALLALNPAIASPQLDEGFEYLSDVIQRHGWDKAKVTFPEVRRMLQVFGTEIGRQMMGENVWVEIARRKIAASKRTHFVITDVRFPNEVAFVQEVDGTLVKVVRPGVGAVNGHVSDAGLSDELFNLTLQNDGTLEDWARTASRLAATV